MFKMTEMTLLTGCSSVFVFKVHKWKLDLNLVLLVIVSFFLFFL